MLLLKSEIKKVFVLECNHNFAEDTNMIRNSVFEFQIFDLFYIPFLCDTPQICMKICMDE